VSLSAVAITRFATADDLPDVTAAYNAGISERIATFETRLRTPADIAGWLSDGRPFIVAERDGRVLGWARAGHYSDRCVYAASASTPSTSTRRAAVRGWAVCSSMS
jgi:L-amino acid N-acyltransferase YncA